VNAREQRLRDALRLVVDVLEGYEDVIIQDVLLNGAYVNAKFVLMETRDPPRKQARVRGGYKTRRGDTGR